MFEIRCLLQESAQASPNQPCLIEAGRSTSYAVLENRVTVLAQAFAALKLPAGARVAVCLPNSSILVTAFLALHRAGLVPCLLSPRLPPRTIAAQAQFCGCALGLIRDGDGRPDQAAGMKWVDPDELFALGGEAPAPGGRPRPAKFPAEAPAAILFTSGSSGAPKAAVLSHRALYYNARGANQNLAVGSNDVWLATLPLCHVGGLGIVYRCLMAGATVAFPTPDTSLTADLETLKVTHVSVVPTQLRRWLTSPAATALAAGLKAVLVGGAPASPDLLAQAFASGFPLRLSYGMTETASQIATTPKYFPEDERFTCGRVLPSRELRVDERGQLQVRGMTLFSGYLRKDGTLDLPVDDDDWFATGDLGSIDERGYVTVTGRLDNLFISGGENIQPEEIEVVLRLLPGVEDAIVVPVDDDEFGQRPFAFVLSADPVPPAALCAHVRKVLPGFKVPVGAHPMPAGESAGLKPSRAALRKLAAKLPRFPG
ncbi:MAG: o-succinylbenzoate--CoA ligase [Kiritimatiellia bacterium]